MQLTFGSGCSGIEAASVAWEPLGWRPAWFAQYDPEHDYSRGPDFASAVLAHHWPHVRNYGDMTLLPGLVSFEEIEAPDVLVAGTPCQSFSIAGLRAGLSDPRGGLSLAYVELANAVDDVRISRGDPPAIVVWENVPGVLTSKDNAFGCFLAALAGDREPYEPPARGKRKSWPDAGVVFGPQRAIAWRVVDAQYFGLAQRRRRVFLVASAREDFHPAQCLFEWDGVRRDIAPSREAREEVAAPAGTCAALRCGCGYEFDDALGVYGCPNCEGDEGPAVSADSDDALLCMAHGQGGAEIARERSPTLTCNHEAPILAFSGKDCGWDAGEVAPPLRAMNSRTGHANGGGQVAVAYAFQPRIARNGRGDMGDVVNALTAQAGETGKGDASPCVAVCYDTTQITNPQNGYNPKPGAPCHPLAAGAHPPLMVASVGGEVSHTLTAEGFDASEDGTGRGQPIVAFGPDESHPYVVRRLIPTECERLQGFPDDHTCIRWRKKVPEDCPDGPRYKALGNSMAVACMRWLGRRIEYALARPWR